MKMTPKLDAKGKPVPGRFIGFPKVTQYVARVLRGGPIELPIESQRRAKARAKRERRAQKRAS